MLGALIKEMYKTKLLSPRLASPFHNLSVHQLVLDVKAFRSLTWRGCSYSYSSYHSSHSHSECTPLNRVQPVIDDLEEAMAGLELKTVKGWRTGDNTTNGTRSELWHGDVE